MRVILHDVLIVSHLFLMDRLPRCLTLYSFSWWKYYKSYLFGKMLRLSEHFEAWNYLNCHSAGVTIVWPKVNVYSAPRTGKGTPNRMNVLERQEGRLDNSTKLGWQCQLENHQKPAVNLLFLLVIWFTQTLTNWCRIRYIFSASCLLEQLTS